MMIILSIFLVIFENLTGILSPLLCQKLCGESYMLAIESKVYMEPRIIDPSCGFYTDMYLSCSLGLLFVVGIVMNVFLGRRSITE